MRTDHPLTFQFVLRMAKIIVNFNSPNLVFLFPNTTNQRNPPAKDLLIRENVGFRNKMNLYMNDFSKHGQFIINRFDHYYANVNNKGSFYVTINTFLIGGIATAYGFIQNTFDINTTLKCLIAIVIISAFVSLALSIFAINPFLKSNNSSKYRTLLYFGSVAEMKEHEVIEEYQQLTDESINKDMAHQIFILALGLKKKYNLLKWAGIILASEFLIIALVIVSILTK